MSATSQLRPSGSGVYEIRSDSVVVPSWAAALLDRLALDDLRVKVRGQSRELDEVLGTIHRAGLRWLANREAAVSGTCVDRGVGEAAPSQLIDTRAAAEILGIQPRRVRQLIQRGNLEARRLGSAWLVDYGSVLLEAARREGKRHG